MRALPSDRQIAPMAQTTITTKVHQTLDVHGNFAPKIAFDLVIPVDRLADLQHISVGKLIDATLGRNPTFSQISVAYLPPMPWIY